MRNYSTRAFAFWAFCALITVLATAASSRAAVLAPRHQVAPRTNGQTYMAAEICQKGGGSGSCCCGARQKIPITSTKKIVKTQTVIKTVTGKKNRLALRENVLEPVEESVASDVTADEEADNHLVSSELEKRWLCPACPAGVKVAKNGKNNGGAVLCCPARKTVVIKRTVTKKVTRTVSAAKKATLLGRVWYDINKNNRYDNPPDLPIANKVIYLVKKSAKKQAARAASLGTTTTDSTGSFVMPFTPVQPGAPLAVVLDPASTESLIEFNASSDGGAPKQDIALLQPVKPTANPPTAALNIATVRGTGVAGNKIVLLCDGTSCGTTTVANDNTYSVATDSKLASGTVSLSVTQGGSNGLASDPVVAGPITILQPPVITSTTLTGGNKATIVGTGAPGATIKIYNAAGTVVGTGLVGQNGAFSILTTALPLGANPFTATQEDANGVSDVIDAGSVTVTQEVFGWSATTLDANDAAVITGTGSAGATVTVYEGVSVVGTAVVDAQGAWSVTSATLSAGDHTFTATQTKSGVTSAAIPAGSVTVGSFTWTATTLNGNDAAVITGTGKAGATITIKEGASTLGTAVVDAQGAWTFTTSTLATGTHTFTATQTVNGVVSSAISAGSVTVGAPTWTATNLNNDNTAVVTGTGKAGATITIKEGVSTLGTATVDAQGGWTFTTAVLTPGTHTFTATETVGSTTSASFSAGSVTVNPAPPTWTSTTLSGGNSAVIEGTGLAGATITIKEGATTLGTAVVDAQGAWTFTAPGLSVGLHSFTATQTLNGATSSSISAGSVTVLATSTTAETTTATQSATTSATATTTTVPKRWHNKVTDSGINGDCPQIALSSDGSKAYAACPSVQGMLYSHDSGKTWAKTFTECTGNCYPQAVATSANGSIVLVSSAMLANSGGVWISRDSGATFAAIPRFANVRGFYAAMSADASVMAVASGSDTIGLISTDGGSTWKNTTGTILAGRHHMMVRMSDDGSIIYFIHNDGDVAQNSIAKSTDYGSTWNNITTMPFTHQVYLICDSTGQKVLIGGSGFTAHNSTTPKYSTDGGSTWTQIDPTNTYFADNSNFCYFGADASLTTILTVEAGTSYLPKATVDGPLGTWVTQDSSLGYTGSWYRKGVAVSRDGNVMMVQSANSIWVWY